MKKGERKWHDAAHELPKRNGTYYVVGVWASGKCDEGECDFMVHDGYFSCVWNFTVTKWRNL